MTPERFAQWLQGFAELSPDTPPSILQWQIIQDHLRLLFIKETPNREQHKDSQPYTNDPRFSRDSQAIC